MEILRLSCFALKIRKIYENNCCDIFFLFSDRVSQIRKSLQDMGDPSRCLLVIDSLTRTLIRQRYRNSKYSVTFVYIIVNNDFAVHMYMNSFFYSPIVNNNFNSGQQVSAPARLSPHSPAGILPFSHPQPLSPRVTQVSAKTLLLYQINKNRKVYLYSNCFYKY